MHSKHERDALKYLLSQMFDDAELQAQLKKAEHIHSTTPNDHLAGECSKYIGILREIAQERATPSAALPPASAVPGPDLETLRKKFGGPKR